MQRKESSQILVSEAAVSREIPSTQRITDTSQRLVDLDLSSNLYLTEVGLLKDFAL